MSPARLRVRSGLLGSIFALWLVVAVGPAWSQRGPDPVAEPLTSGESAADAVTEEQSTADDRLDPQRESFLDSITITATRGERQVGQVTGTVSIVGAETIERRLMTDAADLTRHIPGVYSATVGARYGSGGFNIRGVGGNRVLTQIDGVATLEEFEFGHFDVPSFALDLDSVDSVEILRGSSSSLYGSDALGGVVSFMTKDPAAYLGEKRSHLGFRLDFDGRNDGLGKLVSLARQGDRWQASLSVDRRDRQETGNQGTVDSNDFTRTAADPQSAESTQILGKLLFDLSTSNLLKLTVERFDRSTTTDLLSSQGVVDLGPVFGFPPIVTFVVDKRDMVAEDSQSRLRVSLDQYLQSFGPFDTVSWRLFRQSGDTAQQTREVRGTEFGGGFLGPVVTTDIVRLGRLDFEQTSTGAEVQAIRQLGGRRQAHLLTGGLTVKDDRFDQLRDRQEFDLEDGQALASADGLTYPTKYFPRSRVREVGVYLQDEIDLAGGRLTLVPGVRYDAYDLDADQDDPLYLSGNPGTPAPVDMTKSQLSPRLGAVFAINDHWSLNGLAAEGFRAPPYSAVNSGFTHFSAGVTRLPNPDLLPESSTSFELGVRGSFRRGSFSLTAFDNRYDDFIELMVLGLNPATGFVEFQHRNVASAEIRGLEAMAEIHLGRPWTVHAAWSSIDGEDKTRSQPLNSIPPSEWILGVRYDRPGGRWSGELMSRMVEGKVAADVDATRFEPYRPAGFELIDLTGHYQLTSRLALQAGLFNLLDQTYWEWPAVQGQRASSTTLDRFTAPGRSVSMAARWQW